jgi:hypothetical protein
MKTLSLSLSLALSLALSLLGGCTSHLTVSEIAALDDAILVLDPGTPEHPGLVRVVRIDAASTSATDIALDEGTPTLMTRPGSPDEALVLTAGRLGDARNAPVASELVRIDRTGERGRWTFRGQYDAAQTSRDGRYVVALSPRGRLVVENRVEVVDLEHDASDTNPIAISLRSLGGERPASAELSGTLAWSDGSDLRVAALFAAGQLTLFDLDAPDEPPVTVPTSADARASSEVPLEGFFVEDELVLRPSSGRQLLVVSLVPGTGTRRFDVAVRTLAASASITDIAIDTRGTSPRVLALTASTLDVFDLDTGMSAVVTLGTAYRDMLLFDGPAPGDPTSRPRVALYGGTSSVTFVELGDRPSELLGSFVLPLAFQPDAVIADPMSGRLVVFEDLRRGALELDAAQSYGRRPVSVVDLFDRSALALEASDELSRAVVSTNLDAMWVAGANGYVNRFDLDTDLQEERWLEHSAEMLLPLRGDAQRVIAFTTVRNGSFAILAPGTDPRKVENAW